MFGVKHHSTSLCKKSTKCVWLSARRLYTDMHMHTHTHTHTPHALIHTRKHHTRTHAHTPEASHTLEGGREGSHGFGFRNVSHAPHRTYVCTSIHVYMCICTCVYIHMYVQTYVNIHIYVYTCICIFVYTCMYIDVPLYIYVYI